MNKDNNNTNTSKNTSLTTTKSTETKSTETKPTTKVYNYYSNRKNYDFKGKKNKTKYPEFVKICKLNQMDLKILLPELLIERGYCDVVSGDGYVYAKGEIPVLLTAHMDTVHKENIKDFYEYYDKKKNQHIISSPQGIGGDDRCGVYMILEIIKTHKCSVLFCEDEEIGGIGSNKFCLTDLIYDLENLNYLIELDRANGDDAVFYDCDNKNFTNFILDNTGYVEDYGSFSDISTLSPECRVASVNLSCGYYNAHTTSEYVIVEEMLNTIETVKKLLDTESEQFEYIERYYGRCYGSYYGRYYDGYYDDDYYDYGYSYAKKHNDENTSNRLKSLMIHILDEETYTIKTYVANGTSVLEAFGKFFIKNHEFCYDDIFDYEHYDYKVCEDGWYTDLYD